MCTQHMKDVFQGFPQGDLLVCAQLHQQCVECLSDLARVNQTGERTKPLAQEFVNYPNHTCRARHLLLK